MMACVSFRRILLAAFGALLTASAAPASTLIVNAIVIDGTGAAPKPAAVRIEADRIAAVGDLERRAGETVVDAHGLMLAPGFIDTHSHHDLELFDQPQALGAVSQGITTLVVGQDGTLTYPLEELFRRLSRTPAAVNVAAFIGHNTVRSEVMGEQFKRAASAREIERMRALVRAAMRAGALGLSTGLEYDPGIYSTREEVLTLAREAAKGGGRYISHLRSEDRALWQAVEEIVEIGRATRMPVQISHIKLAMTDWWGQAPRLLATLDKARAAGIDVTADVYPYEYWQSTLAVLFPERDFSNRASAEFALRSLVRPQDLRITRYSPDRTIEGKTLAAIAQERAVPPADLLMDLVAKSQLPGADEEVIGTSMHADDVAALIAWPHSNICSDGSLVDAHPRGAGAFTRVLRVYVRERGLLSWQEAIRKMTSVAAAHMGFADRGVIRAGAFADLVLFDPARVTDRATLEAPAALSEGIETVWVNGEAVFSAGRATGARTGRAIRRGA
jgi:N-acyl-D-amino-acid deacylase